MKSLDGGFAVNVGSLWSFECYSHHHADGSKCPSPWDGADGKPCCPEGIPFEQHEHRLRWNDTIKNLVVTAGRNKLLDATFKTGLAAPAWYVGLKDTGTPDAADTMGSHVTWATISPYSNATDPAFTPGTISAGAVNNSASKAVFTINGTDDVFGAFLKDDNTVDGTTGTLYGAGDFTGGTRSVLSGDTLMFRLI
jgi:hypothetical protein